MKDTRGQDFFLRLFLALLLFLIVVTLSPLTSDPTDIKVFLYQWGGFVGVAALFATRRPWRRPRIFFWLMIGFVGLYAAAAAQSRYPGNSAVDVSKFLSLFFLYLVASHVYRSPKDVAPLMLAVCLAIACSSIYAFFQKAGLDPFPWDPRYLASDSFTELPGTFGNPNLAAHALILAEIFALYLASKGGAWRFCYVFVPLFVAHHVYTGQRGGLVALAAAAGLLLVAHAVCSRMKKPLQAVLVSLVLTAVLGTGCLAGVMVLTKSRTGTIYPLDMALLVRYKSYCSASSMILERPILGYGPRNYRIENPAFWTDGEQRWFAEDGKKNDNAHIDVLESGVDAGLPGAVLYLALLTTGVGFGLLYAFSREEREQRRFGYMCAAFFCAFGVDGLFGFNIRVPVSAALFFLMAGALDGVWSSDAKQTKNRWAWRSALILVALANAVFATRVFQSNVLYQQGVGAIDWKAYSEADSLLSQGEALAPWNWLFGYQRGIAARGLNRPDEAIEHLTRSLTRNPNRIATLMALADTHARVGKARLSPPETNGGGEEASSHLDAADNYARRALTLCRFLPEPYQILGRTALLRSDSQSTTNNAWLEAAKDNLTSAVNLGSNNQSELLSMLADIYIKRSDFTKAEASLMQAIQADADSDEPWSIFLRLAQATNEYGRLRQELEAQLARLDEPGNASQAQAARLSYWLARTLEIGVDDPDAVHKAYRGALAKDDIAVWAAYWHFAVAHERTDAFRTDLADAVARLEHNAQDVPPHLAAICLVWRNGPEALNKAMEMLATVELKGQTTNYLYEWVADILLTEADKAPQTAEVGTAYLNLGQLYVHLGNVAKARRPLLQAVPLLSEEYQLIGAQAYAEALYRLEHYSEAEAFLSALDALRTAPGLWEVYGDVLAKTNQHGPARAEYEALLQTPTLSPERQRAILEKLKLLRR